MDVTHFVGCSKYLHIDEQSGTTQSRIAQSRTAQSRTDSTLLAVNFKTVLDVPVLALKL